MAILFLLIVYLVISITIIITLRNRSYCCNCGKFSMKRGYYFEKYNRHQWVCMYCNDSEYF